LKLGLLIMAAGKAAPIAGLVNQVAISSGRYIGGLGTSWRAKVLTICVHLRESAAVPICHIEWPIQGGEYV
jgi:hypothetical protein